MRARVCVRVYLFLDLGKWYFLGMIPLFDCFGRRFGIPQTVIPGSLTHRNGTRVPGRALLGQKLIQREMAKSLANRLRSTALLELMPRATSAHRSSVRAWDLMMAGSSPSFACCRRARATVHEGNENCLGSGS